MLPNNSIRRPVNDPCSFKCARLAKKDWICQLTRFAYAQIEYPEIEEDFVPRHRFMSSFEQRVEAADKSYQYLLFAAEPYEVIAFKIPNSDIDRAEDKFFTYWFVHPACARCQIRSLCCPLGTPTAKSSHSNSTSNTV